MCKHFVNSVVYKPYFFCYTMLERIGSRPKKGCVQMNQRSAILLLPDDTQKTGERTPLLLQNILGTPLLKWLTESLWQQGVIRFFLAAPEEFCDAAAACFPREAELTVARDDSAADLLHVFLSTGEGPEKDVLAITGPVVFAPSLAARDPDKAPVPAPVCLAPRQGLMGALDEGTSIAQFLQDESETCTDREGFYAVSSAVELPRWGQSLRQLQLAYLRSRGVEIWDYQSCYVAPGIPVGVGTTLLPGTILEGDCTVGYGCKLGPNTHLIDTSVGNRAVIDSSRVEKCKISEEALIGPFANLRAGTQIGVRAKAGAFVEMKNTQIGELTQVAHLSYLGDANVGARVNVGCGTVTANFDRVNKHETVIEDDVFLGCNTALIAPITVGEGAYIGAGSVVSDDVPPQALALSRARQQTKKDWAAKHKLARD